MSDVALRFGASDDGLIAYFRRVTKELDLFDKATDKASSAAQRGFKALKPLIAGVSFAVLVRESLALADNLEKLSAQTGIGVESLQRLQFIAAQSSVSFESVSGAVNRLQKALTLSGEGSAEATAALDRLGISINEIAGLAPDQQFLKVADAISKIEDPARQTTAAVAIFGRGGAELLPILKQTAEESAAVAEGFDAIGGSISADTTKSVDDLGDSLGNVKTAVVSLGVELLGLVSGPLTSAANEISQVIGDIRLLAGGGTEIKKLEKELQLLQDAQGSIPLFFNFGYIDGSPVVMGPEAIATRVDELRRKIVELTLAGQGIPGISVDTPKLLDSGAAPGKPGKATPAAPAALTPEELRIKAQNESKATINADYYEVEEIAFEEHQARLLELTQDFGNRRFVFESDLQNLLAQSRQQFGLQEINWEEIKSQSIFEIAGGLFSSLASQNEKFAKVQQGIALAQAVWYTASGVANALRSVPFPANISAAAKVAAVGAIQIAKIKATSFSNGGGAASGGISVGGAGSAQATLPEAPAATGAQTKAQTNIYLNGNFAGPDSARWIVDALRDEFDRDVTLFGGSSRQSLELGAA